MFFTLLCMCKSATSPKGIKSEVKQTHIKQKEEETTLFYLPIIVSAKQGAIINFHISVTAAKNSLSANPRRLTRPTASQRRS